MFGRSAAAASPAVVSTGLGIASTPKEAWAVRLAPGPPGSPACPAVPAGFSSLLGVEVTQAVDYDAAQFEQGSEMPKGPDVSVIVEQIKTRLSRSKISSASTSD